MDKETRKYEKPTIVSLGDMARGAGACNPGNSNIENWCSDGNINETGTCSTGGANYGSYCSMGTSDQS